MNKVNEFCKLDQKQIADLSPDNFNDYIKSIQSLVKKHSDLQFQYSRIETKFSDKNEDYNRMFKEIKNLLEHEAEAQIKFIYE